MMKEPRLFLNGHSGQLKRRLPALQSWNAFSVSSLRIFRGEERKRGWGEIEDEIYFSFSQWFVLFLWLYTFFIFFLLICDVNSFVVVSLSVCLFLHHPLLPLVNMHYSQRAQWQFSPSAIWDQYWVSSTTNWPDILISVIQTKCYAFYPPTRQPTVYSPSEWLKSNGVCKHKFTDDYL